MSRYEATKPVAPDAVRKSIAEWAENDDLCDRLNALFEKTNDPEDFLSFAKIQFKVQQDGCTVSKTLIGRALTKLGFEARPKKNKIQVEPSWGERVSKNGARKSDRLWV